MRKRLREQQNRCETFPKTRDMAHTPTCQGKGLQDDTHRVLMAVDDYTISLWRPARSWHDMQVDINAGASSASSSIETP